ncbi:MAG: PH domain-containing protein [Planctomycetota bacterium]|nr:PH domain-containing protein [Planctomycetota bacterium]
MSYVKRNLMPGETIVATAKLHWIMFLRTAVLLLFSILLLSCTGLLVEPVAVWALRISGLGLLLVALGAGAKALIRLVTSEYAVTNKRVLVKVGLIRRDSLELLLAKIEAIGVNQSVLGRLLGYGTLVITGTGGSANAYHGIASPLAFRLRVQEQIGSVQDKP